MDGKGQLDPSVQISTLIDGNPELNARTETMSPSNIEDAPPENVDSNTKSVAADSHDFKSPALAQESNVIKSPTLSVLGNVQDEPCGNVVKALVEEPQPPPTPPRVSLRLSPAVLARKPRSPPSLWLRPSQVMSSSSSVLFCFHFGS